MAHPLIACLEQASPLMSPLFDTPDRLHLTGDIVAWTVFFTNLLLSPVSISLVGLSAIRRNIWWHWRGLTSSVFLICLSQWPWTFILMATLSAPGNGRRMTIVVTYGLIKYPTFPKALRPLRLSLRKIIVSVVHIQPMETAIFSLMFWGLMMGQFIASQKIVRLSFLYTSFCTFRSLFGDALIHDQTK